MIVVNGCQCATKWQVIKAHIKQCWFDMKTLDQVCIIADHLIVPSASSPSPEILDRIEESIKNSTPWNYSGEDNLVRIGPKAAVAAQDRVTELRRLAMERHNS